MRAILAALLLVAGCGVRAPSHVDVAALVRARGAVDARRELTARVLAHPRDVGARLALAELSDQQGRPSDAIDQLEAVLRLGGPIGTRWHDTDRARLGRLLLARGRVRLARGAASALEDLQRAASFGAPVRPEELEQARVAVALAQLRHVDERERAKGRATLGATIHDAWGTTTPAWVGVPAGAWSGARAGATPAQRGAFGAWAWSIGARREGYEQLAAWHDATPAPRDETMQGAYLRALAWWSPLWLGEVAPPPAADLVGPERCWFPGADCAPPAEAGGAPPPAAEEAPTDPRAAVAARYAATRVVARGQVDAAALVPIARAFAREPVVAERLGRELVATSTDAALAHATLGALFDALGDPGRARAAWQAAVAASAEPAFVRGLAEAAARGGDGPAALVFATAASAASGDPAVVWAAVAQALLDARLDVDALTAAHNALDLAGPEVLPRALDVAIAASKLVGRPQQADALLVQRAQLGPRVKTEDADARAALAAHREQPTASTVARLWVASRAQPRDVELRAVLLEALDPDDPRRATLVAELVALAGDPDPDRAFAAVTALRH